MKREAEMNADSDKKAKEEADKINAADGLIFQSEKQLKDYLAIFCFIKKLFIFLQIE